MTRKLRPPRLVRVQCGPDGLPSHIDYGGRRRLVTKVAAHWLIPPPWWSQATTPEEECLAREDRRYFRLVTDGAQICEAFRLGEQWYLDRIVD
jgi:hypothetical protein